MGTARWAPVRIARGAAAAAIIAGTALLTPVAAWGASPSVHASPSTNIKDAQTISVSASGYPANATIEFVECHRTYGCDFSTSQYFRSNASGATSGQYVSTRVITADKKSIDCAKTSNCELAAVNYPNPTAIAATAIRFDPNAPIVPPLKISMSLDGTDGVVVSSGVAILHGNVTCNRATQVYVEADITQSQNGTISQAYGDSEMECTTAQTIPWQLSINPQSQYFVAGPAQVNVYANAYSNRSSSHANAGGTVILQAANLPTINPSGAHVTVPASGQTVVLHYWIVLSAPSQFNVSFSYSTLNGTATAPTDYVSTTGFATIKAGATKAIVPITINGTNESPGNRTFIVSVENPSNAAVGTNHGRGTVTLHHN